MSMHDWKSLAVIPLAMGLAAPSAVAQISEPSHPCASVVESDDRLACYDKAFPPGPGVEVAGADLEALRQKAVEEFGLNRQQLFDRKPEHQREVEPDRIEGIVKRVVVRADGGRVVTLENDQVWLMTEATSRGRLEPGDKVTIREAALGSYMLLTSSRVPLRARRLR